MRLHRLALLVVLLLAAACGPRRVVLNGIEMTEDEAARAELQLARDKAKIDPAAAAPMFSDVQTRYPDSAEADEALFGAGESYEAAGDKARARASYERLASAYPGSDKAPLARARAAALGGDASKAIEAARDAFDQIPTAEKYAAAVALAQSAEKGGRFAEAFRFREEALSHAAPGEQRTAAELALTSFVDGVLPLDVLTTLAADAGKGPGAPLLRWKLAKVLAHLRDTARLQQALQDFLSAHPDHRWAAEARARLDKLGQRGSADPKKLGVILPLSGNPTYKRAGEQYLAGLKLALDGSGVELVVRDSRGEPLDAAAAVEQLVYDDHVIAIVGGVITSEAQAIALKASELETPVILFSRAEGVTGLGEWVFRAMLTSTQMADALAQYAIVSRGVKKFGILHPELQYGEELRDAFKLSVEARGAKVTNVAGYPQDETTYSDAIKKLVGRFDPQDYGAYRACMETAKAMTDLRKKRNAVEKCKQMLTPVMEFKALLLPDKWQNIALVSAGLAFEDVITNWCDKKDVERIEKTTGKKITPVMLLGANLWNHPDLARRGGKYVSCSVFVDGFYATSTRPETVKFTMAFTQANGRAPGLLEAYGAEAGVVLRAVSEGRKPGTRTAFREALLATKDVPSPMGLTNVTAERELVHPLYFLTVDRGELREADPAKTDGPP